MDHLISREYKALLQKKHQIKSWGGGGKSWVVPILTMLNRLPPGPITVLDFGCGRGTFKPALLELYPDAVVTEYDPGVAGKDVLPMKPVDYVVCTDVMEHVEEAFVESTLRTINWLAIHGVFFNIDLGVSKSFLPDGQNTHITIKPASWWIEKLNANIPEMKWMTRENTRYRLVISGWREKGVE